MCVRVFLVHIKVIVGVIIIGSAIILKIPLDYNVSIEFF